MSRAGIPEARLIDLSLKNRLLHWARSYKKHLSLGALIFAGTVGFIWFIVWVATPRELIADVEDISWMYITNLRQREVRHDGDWGHQGTRGHYDEPVFNERCYSKYYSDETYVCGSYETSYDCGNGQTCYNTNYIYCTRDVYRTWCDYDYYEWPVVATKQTMGSTHETYWDNFQPDGPLQRVQKIQSYEVNFQTFDDKFQYKPDSLSDFKRFNPHDRWKLQVGRIRRHNIEKMTKQ
jgi:hypothetical protein